MDRGRRPSSSVGDQNQPPNGYSSVRQGPQGPYSQGTPPLSNQSTSNGAPNILQYCMGAPQKINSSHFGGVELSVCLQENAVFLPARANNHHRAGNNGPADPNGTANGAGAQPSLSNGSDHGPSNPVDLMYTTDSLGGTETVAVSDPQEMTPEASVLNNVALEAQDEVLPTFEDANAANVNPSATLRGSVLLRLAKPTKIKEVSVSFYCVSRTVWNLVPQPNVLVDTPLPSSAEVEDVAYLGIHHWDFVPLKAFGAVASVYDRAIDQSATLIGQDLYGADTVIYKDSPNEVHHRKLCRTLHNSACRVRGRAPHQIPVFSPMSSQPRKLKQPNVQADGVQFPAGEYVYHFSIIIDSSTPESVGVPNGHVKFFVSPRVVRSGPFAPNLQGKVEVDVVRSPPETTDSLGNDHVLLCRVWDDRLVYSVNLEKRYLTLDTTAKLVLTLLPIPGGQVEVHQIRAYLMEVVSYLYSLDASVRTSDSSLRLLLFQQNAPQDESFPGSTETRTGTLLHPTEPTELKCNLQLATTSEKPMQELPQAYGRGRFGEKRFLQPDVKGPYIRVKHRLVVILRVSKINEHGSRSHFEVKIDTPVIVLSKYCVNESIHLPLYGSENLPSSDVNGEDDGPPSFDDALTHELVGRPGVIPGQALLDKPPR